MKSEIRYTLASGVILLLLVPFAGAGEAINVAPLGVATQSTTCFNDPAELAIDGDLGNFTHTCWDDPEPRWEVDLGDTYDIETIVIHNRTSCCGSS